MTEYDSDKARRNREKAERKLRSAERKLRDAERRLERASDRGSRTTSGLEDEIRASARRVEEAARQLAEETADSVTQAAERFVRDSADRLTETLNETTAGRRRRRDGRSRRRSRRDRSDDTMTDYSGMGGQGGWEDWGDQWSDWAEALGLGDDDGSSSGRRRSRRRRGWSSNMRSYRRDRRRGYRRNLYRDRERGKIAGVCAGLATYFNTEPWVVRLFAVMGFFFFGIPHIILVAYGIGWLALDDKPYSSPKREEREAVKMAGRNQPAEEPEAAPPKEPVLSSRSRFRNARARFNELELRLRQMESYVTSTHFEFDREMRGATGPDQRLNDDPEPWIGRDEEKRGETGRYERPMKRNEQQSINHTLRTGIGRWLTGVLLMGAAGSAFADRVEEVRDVAEFQRVVMKGSGVMNFTQGVQSVTVEARDDVIDGIRTEVRGGTLYVGYEGHQRNIGRIRYDIVVAEPEALEIHGSGSARVSDVSRPWFELRDYGSGDIDAQALELETLEVLQRGSGNVEVGGAVDEQFISIQGSGDYRARRLASRTADIRIRGSGDATVNVSGRASVKIHGSGDVRVYGDADIDEQTFGSGDVVRGD